MPPLVDVDVESLLLVVCVPVPLDDDVDVEVLVIVSVSEDSVVASVVVEGKVQTYDMAKMSGRSDVIDKGAATTHQMADAIIAKLN